ncbi:MAG TPA: hypothetical protein VK663_12645 [Burkholderiales bacterium]|nr:hypothetical protein [Burkholderiales bacterium]
MSSLTTEQVAELLLGIARSQLAMVDAIESSKAGFKATHLRSNVESAARIKMNRPVVLADIPSRLLLQMLGRNPPTPEAVARELESLLAENTAVLSGLSLDMTK